MNKVTLGENDLLKKLKFLFCQQRMYWKKNFIFLLEASNIFFKITIIRKETYVEREPGESANDRFYFHSYKLEDIKLNVFVILLLPEEKIILIFFIVFFFYFPEVISTDCRINIRRSKHEYFHRNYFVLRRERKNQLLSNLKTRCLRWRHNYRL